MGKTEWARSLGSHIYFCGIYSASEAFRAHEVEYAIFDDLQGGMKFFFGFKNWLGCQQQFQVKALYKDPVLITWGKPCILLSNTDPRMEMSDADNEWLEGNVSFVYVGHPLFTTHASTE